MKRNRESRYRMKLIQEFHYGKEQQKYIDKFCKSSGYYEYYRQLHSGDGFALLAHLTRMLGVSFELSVKSFASFALAVKKWSGSYGLL